MTTFTRIFHALKRNAIAVIPTTLAIVILNFFLLNLAPGDAADVLAGESGAATVETEFRPWDVVYLRSGGPYMTVTANLKVNGVPLLLQLVREWQDPQGRVSRERPLHSKASASPSRWTCSRSRAVDWAAPGSELASGERRPIRGNALLGQPQPKLTIRVPPRLGSGADRVMAIGVQRGDG